MATISQTPFLKAKGPIDSKSALVQVMVWPQTGDKPLPELTHWGLVTQLTDPDFSFKSNFKIAEAAFFMLHKYPQLIKL